MCVHVRACMRICVVKGALVLSRQHYRFIVQTPVIIDVRAIVFSRLKTCSWPCCVFRQIRQSFVAFFIVQQTVYPKLNVGCVV